MDRISEDQIDDIVRHTLHDMAADVLPADLIVSVVERNNKITAADIRKAIWRLISDGKVQLSSEQKLRPVEDEAQAAS